MDVSDKLQKIDVFFTDNGFIASLKEVPPAPIVQIVMACISKLQALHDFRKRRLLDFDQQMNVGGHKDIRVEEEGITAFVLFQEPKIELVILS